MSRNLGEIGTKSGENLKLGECVFVFETNELVLESGQKPALRSQSSEVLAYLARRSGHLVSKDEMVAAIWKDTFVTDDSLVQCIADIRRALGDDDRRIVETLVNRGYRLNSSQPDTEKPLFEEIPRVAVLAFEDHSTGANRGQLSDAIASGVITELAHFGEFSVVSRGSSFKFRSGDLGLHEIGNELGAQYIVEGSQQVVGGTLRVTVQLIDVRTEVNIWTDTHEYDFESEFAGQTEAIRKIAASAGFQICAHSPSLIGPKHRSAMYYFLASRADVHQSTLEELQNAEVMNRKAIKADPKSPYGYIGMAFCEGGKYWHRWEPVKSYDGLVLAGEYADKALELAPRNSQAHFARGSVHKEAGELDAAEVRLKRALVLNSHLLQARIVLAFVAFYRGETQDAVVQIERTMETNPDHPDWFFASYAAALRNNCEYDKALAVFRNMSSIPGSNHMQLGAIYVGLGRQAEAEAAMQEFLKRSPHHTVSRERFFEEQKFVKPADLHRWLDLIRQAGLPD